jgi:putative flippase GtrA
MFTYLIYYLNLWIRGIPVGIISTGSDIISLYLLNKYSNYDLNIQLYISSIIALFISFIGNKFWTFKNKSSSENNLLIQILLYLVFELIFIYLLTEIVITIINYSNKLINNDYKEYIIHNNFLLRIKFIEYDNNKNIKISNNYEIILKHILIMILYTFISLPIYDKYIFIK